MSIIEKTLIITNKKYHIINVGSSKNPSKRLKTIQISNNTELEIVCVFEGNIEKEIKDLLEKYKVRGEWYYPDPKTLLKIQEKYLPHNQDLASFIYTLFGEIKMSDHSICLCWVDDEKSKCQFKRNKNLRITCESYEIWKACVRKEEID
ncbi:MAG: GIY-YIG nuclease family protein [Candidatus Hodarchaeales archaeon]|jgi:hypothetical protein